MESIFCFLAKQRIQQPKNGDLKMKKKKLRKKKKKNVDYWTVETQEYTDRYFYTRKK